MKFTKYTQSCVLVQTRSKRILIDPGYLDYNDKYLEDEWKDVDAILVTHKHKDHIHIPAVLALIEKGAKLYTSKEVLDTYSELNGEIVKVGDLFDIDGLKVEVVKAVHGFIPSLKGGNEINENIGFILDDSSTRAYFTSDSICFDNNYKCDVLFIPVCGHGLVFDPFSAKEFAKMVQAKLVIPIHYDNPKFPADLELVEDEFSELNYKFVKTGESFEY